MWDLPQPGIKSMSSALAGRFFTTKPPGKPCPWCFATRMKSIILKCVCVCVCVYVWVGHHSALETMALEREEEEAGLDKGRSRVTLQTQQRALTNPTSRFRSEMVLQRSPKSEWGGGILYPFVDQLLYVAYFWKEIGSARQFLPWEAVLKEGWQLRAVFWSHFQCQGQGLHSRRRLRGRVAAPTQGTVWDRGFIYIYIYLFGLVGSQLWQGRSALQLMDSPVMVGSAVAVCGLSCSLDHQGSHETGSFYTQK